MKKNIWIAVLVVALAGFVWLVSAGDLEPPGPPDSTMQTLDVIGEKIDALLNAEPAATIGQYVGVTTATTQGDGGWKDKADHCQDEFGSTYPSIRMCTTGEIMRTPSPQWPTFDDQDAAWMHPTIIAGGSRWVDISGMSNPDPAYLSCSGWSSADIAVRGLVLSGEGHFTTQDCARSTRVTCCAPANEIP